MELTAGSTKVDIVASVVVDTSLGQHSVVLNLRLADRGAVVGDDDQFGLAAAESLESGLVAQSVLARLHDQSQSGVDVLRILLGFLGGNHICKFTPPSQLQNDECVKIDEVSLMSRQNTEMQCKENRVVMNE